MKITCPECGFSREVAPEKLPKSVAVATCPKCSCRFRFSAAKGAMEILPPKGWRTLDGKPNVEGEEDIRLVAKRAYEREAARFQTNASSEPNELPPLPAENPWAVAPGDKGWVASFFQTVARVMFSAPAFFAGLRTGVSQTRPLLFYAILCVFQTVVERLWGRVIYETLMSESSADPELARLLSMLAPDNNFALALILRCGALFLQLYLFAFLMALAYKLVAPQKSSFNLLFQILSYSSAPSVLCVVPVLGSLAGLIWGVGCLAVGCKAALELSWPRTLVGFLPAVIIIAPLLSQMLAVMGR